MLIEDLAGVVPTEVVRDLQAIATSGERLVAMIEEHVGAAKRSIDELDLPDAQFQLRLQLNHISDYTEMLREVAEEDGRDEMFDDLDRIAAAEQRMLELLERQLQVESFEAERSKAEHRGHAGGRVPRPDHFSWVLWPREGTCSWSTPIRRAVIFCNAA